GDEPLTRRANGAALVDIARGYAVSHSTISTLAGFAKSREIRICSSARPFLLGSRYNLSCSNICTRVVQLLLQASHSTCQQNLQRSRLALAQRHPWAALPLCPSSS